MFQGSPQVISFQFEDPVIVERIDIQFQGGFAGKDCRLEITSSETGQKTFCEFYPEDVNQLQVSFSKPSAILPNSLP